MAPTPYRAATSTTKTGFEPDSSGEEDNITTNSHASTSTILGFADGSISNTTDEDDWRVSRIGGLPTFPPLMNLPPKSWSTCSECGSVMPLLLQIYSPREGSLFERILYTFGCTFDGCKGFRAFRICQKWLEEEESIVEEVVELNPFLNHFGIAKVDMFGSGNPFATTTSSIPSNSNPFSSNPFAPPPLSNSNPFAVKPNPIEGLAQLSLAEPSTPSTVADGPTHLRWPASTLSESFPSLYLTTSYEPIISTPKASKLSQQSSTYLPLETSREGKGSGGRIKKGAINNKPNIKAGSNSTGGGGEEGGWGTEGYEVQKVIGVDEVFLRFLERVGREGSQLIRYAFNSIPLAYSIASPYQEIFSPTKLGETEIDSLGYFDSSLLGSCENCGKEKTFEYQLMPNLCSILKGIEFATVMIFTCKEECVIGGEESWMEEKVIVQFEE